MKKIRLALILLLLLVLVAPIMAQVSQRYDLTWYVLSGGGGHRASLHVEIDDVWGQWADARSNSANYQIEPGYWHVGRVVTTNHYLPAIFKPR